MKKVTLGKESLPDQAAPSNIRAGREKARHCLAHVRVDGFTL